MFVPFAFTAGSRDGGSRVTREGCAARRARSTVRATCVALSFSDDGDVSGDVVFAGYGIVVPESQTFGYDSYAGLDVKDKVVLVLRYFPEDADQATRAILARYSDLRYKALAARQRGARGHPGRHRTGLPQRRHDDPDDLRHGARGVGHQRRQHQRARGGGHSRRSLAAGAAEGARQRQPARGGRGHRQRGAAQDRRRPPEARRPQRRGLSARDRPGRRESIGRGWPSARTTITWGAAPAATRWPRATRPARRTSAPTTTPRARRRCC